MTAMPDVAALKQMARTVWSTGNFGDIAVMNTPVSAHLMRAARVAQGNSVLDIGTGTGNVAIMARAAGADATGIDLTPELLEEARLNETAAGLDGIDWRVGDAEELPFPDASFDIVVSQFGHMFAPRPDLATREMLRVLKPGGRLAFATFPPEHLGGRMFALNGKYGKPSSAPPPGLWGVPSVIEERLADGVDGVHFERGVFPNQALTVHSFLAGFQAKFGPVVLMARALAHDPERLAAWQQELHALVSQYYRDGAVWYDYLVTSAIKA